MGKGKTGEKKELFPRKGGRGGEKKAHRYETIKTLEGLTRARKKAELVGKYEGKEKSKKK